ncbi:efflux RND transporter periplasmic adaptor subunit [Parabacteroides sp. Marseille-P3160]|uniref:efflux RND transporter periplasmic adaptor subunit n=1 Tax=Parabacteroides sp. Marseille-P3160 TaxID=1917887 RepID=UPI0009BBFFC4|nr:efflux RND transporter periplasmic adaptor subunit [Parabacteroides sp. Marseille-P3160]
MKRKSTIWISIVFILLVAFFLRLGFSKASDEENKREPKEKKQKKVDGFIAKPSLLITEITVSGSLLALEEVELKNEVAGRVVMINLPEGKPVKEGTLLVKLFDDDLQATLKKLEVQLAIQQKIYERQTELLKVNGITLNDYEQTGLQLSSLKADIEVEKTLIRKTEVRAPFDGVIGLRSISVGAIISPSTLLATIRTEDKIKLDFSVPEKYGPMIKTGMKIKFSTTDVEKQFNATVIATEEGVDASTRNLKIRALVNTKSPDLLPGSFSNVSVRLNENPDALLIPIQSIIPQEDTKTVIVARGGKAHFVEIKTGIRQASSIEVIEGIQSGDTIVTSGLQFLKEGSQLLFSSVKK